MMEHPSNVSIVSVAELQEQGIAYTSSVTELEMNGQRFKKHLSLRLLFHQVCLNYCQREIEQGRQCFLVQEETCFSIWQSETSQLDSLENQSGEHSAVSPGEAVAVAEPSPTENLDAFENSSIADEQPSADAKQPGAYQRVYRGVYY